MNPETTFKVTEDTNTLQRKIIYKDRLLIEYPVMNPLGSNANWTIYFQEDGASRYAVGSQSVTISQLKYSGNFTADAVVTYMNDLANYQSYKLPYLASFSSATYPNYTTQYWNAILSNDNGALKITFSGKVGEGIPTPGSPVQPTYIYYVIYSTSITSEAVL